MKHSRHKDRGFLSKHQIISTFFFKNVNNRIPLRLKWLFLVFLSAESSRIAEVDGKQESQTDEQWVVEVGEDGDGVDT